jgi:hypothetical protein
VVSNYNLVKVEISHYSCSCQLQQLSVTVPVVVTVAVAVVVTVVVVSRQLQLQVTSCANLEIKLKGATNFRGMHLYISYIMRVFAGDAHLAKGHLSKQ